MQNDNPRNKGPRDLDPDEDASEIPGIEATNSATDSPGDDAILAQEELYEGISSERMPSEKQN